MVEASVGVRWDAEGRERSLRVLEPGVVPTFTRAVADVLQSWPKSGRVVGNADDLHQPGPHMVCADPAPGWLYWPGAEQACGAGQRLVALRREHRGGRMGRAHGTCP